MKRRKRPKQNFEIGFERILNSDYLSAKARLLLIKILNHHKDNCKYDYVNLLNKDLCDAVEVREPNMIKYRKELIDKKFITLQKERSGRSFLLIYRLNWRKLSTKDFIKPTEENKFAPVKKEKKQKKDAIDPNGLYEFSYDQIRLKDYGKELLKRIKINNNPLNKVKAEIKILNRIK